VSGCKIPVSGTVKGYRIILKDYIITTSRADIAVHPKR
jgi:hypothetical protein